jgi:hypothetical protein
LETGAEEGMTLGIFLDRIAEVVGDPSRARYSDAVIEEGLRLALEEYSKVSPQILETTVTVDSPGRDQVILLNGGLWILSVLFPVTDASAPEVESYYAYLRGGNQWLKIGSPAPEPQSGDTIRVLYGAAHTISELDAAQETTVPLADFGLLVQGAAGHAMSIRADSIVEAYGKRTPQTDQAAAARRRLDDFRRRLRARKGAEQPANPWTGGWKLDSQDRGGA